MKTNAEILAILKPALEAILKHENASGNDVTIKLESPYSFSSTKEPQLTISAWVFGDRIEAGSLDDLVSKVLAKTPQSAKEERLAKLKQSVSQLETELAQLKAT